MAATNELYELLEKTGPIRELMISLREEPVKMLLLVVEEQNKTGRPVPDHLLRAGHYLGQVSLRALLEAGLVEKADPGRRFVSAYQPTEKGRKYAQLMKSAPA